MMTRRQAFSAISGLAMARPAGTLVDTHIHLFASDQSRFPYHPNAPYKPPAQPVEDYVKFAAAARIDHAVIVHPEPYQDDHRYLEYCLSREHRPGFFKATCLFDPIAPDTPARMEALVKKLPDRIVAMRIHEVRPAGEPPASSGAIKERDLSHPAMRATWKQAQSLGLAIQMHFVPCHAPQIGELAAAFPKVPVVLDHLGRAGQGTPAEFEGVLKLAQLPRTYMKYSGVNYSSRQPYPFPDARPFVRKVYDAFGPGRIIWGGLGYNLEEFDQQAKLLDLMFDYASESDRARIRGLNALEVYRFRPA